MELLIWLIAGIVLGSIHKVWCDKTGRDFWGRKPK